MPVFPGVHLGPARQKRLDYSRTVARANRQGEDRSIGVVPGLYVRSMLQQQVDDLLASEIRDRPVQHGIAVGINQSRMRATDQQQLDDLSASVPVDRPVQGGCALISNQRRVGSQVQLGLHGLEGELSVPEVLRAQLAAESVFRRSLKPHEQGRARSGRVRRYRDATLLSPLRHAGEVRGMGARRSGLSNMLFYSNSPADGGPVGSQGAGAVAPGADHLESAAGRRVLNRAPSPTQDGAVGAYSTAVVPAHAQICQRPNPGRMSLTPAPPLAHHHRVGRDSAGVVAPDLEGDEVASWGRYGAAGARPNPRQLRKTQSVIVICRLGT